MAQGADLTGAFLLPGKHSVQLPFSASSVSNTSLSSISCCKYGLKSLLYSRMDIRMAYISGKALLEL